MYQRISVAARLMPEHFNLVFKFNAFVVSRVLLYAFLDLVFISQLHRLVGFDVSLNVLSSLVFGTSVYFVNILLVNYSDISVYNPNHCLYPLFPQQDFSVPL